MLVQWQRLLAICGVTGLHLLASHHLVQTFDIPLSKSTADLVTADLLLINISPADPSLDAAQHKKLPFKTETDVARANLKDLPPLLPIPSTNQIASSEEGAKASNDEIVFYDLIELDEPARPPDDFDAQLRASLPIVRDSYEIEFWIDHMGSVVRLNCVSLNCFGAVRDNFEQLLLVRFEPAVRQGNAVSSRKLVFVDAPEAFGL